MTDRKDIKANGCIESGTCQKSVSERRTCLERVLILLLASCLLVVIVLAILLVQSEKTVQSDICLTKECTDVASRVSSSIDYGVDPCNNFYDFACGSWIKKHVVPDDRSNLYTYGVVRENVKITLKYLLEGTQEEDMDSIKKARDYYQSCMNETQIEYLNTSVLITLLEELGGWPTLGRQPGGGSNESGFDVMADLVALRTYGVSPFIKIYVGPDEKDTEKRVVHIAEPHLTMRNKVFLFDMKYAHIREAYLTYGTNVAVLLGADSTIAANDMVDLFELDKKLANLTLSNTERRDTYSQYNKMNISTLEANFSASGSQFEFSWTTYIQRIMDIPDENVTIDGSEEVIMENPRYFKEVLNILGNTDKRTIRNYIAWNIVAQLINKLPKRFIDEFARYRKAQIGKNSRESRWKICSQSAVYYFGMAIGRLFVRETFDEEAKRMALEMIHDIRDAFYERLDELEWMDPETKVVAKDKAKHITEKIGFPDFILDDKELNEYYQSMEASKDEYFKNTMGFLKVFSKSSLQSLREPYEKDSRWEVAPSTVNAYYTPVLNLISFPAGMLQPPYYSKYQPRSMNYGSVGWLIGHEITHAFDDIGRKFDKEGNLRQWWSDSAIDKFNNKAKCIIDQYNAYVAPSAGMNIDGEYTVGENIADNGGLKQSYKAYQHWLEKHNVKEPTLPGINFTHSQLFFINFAQGWCGVTTKQYEIDQIHTDTHSPGRFRIIGSLQNSEEFASVFNCPSGSYMNPKHKCHVW